MKAGCCAGIKRIHRKAREDRKDNVVAALRLLCVLYDQNYILTAMVATGSTHQHPRSLPANTTSGPHSMHVQKGSMLELV